MKKKENSRKTVIVPNKKGCHPTGPFPHSEQTFLPGNHIPEYDHLIDMQVFRRLNQCEVLISANSPCKRRFSKNLFHFCRTFD